MKTVYDLIIEQPFFRGLSQTQLRVLAPWSKPGHTTGRAHTYSTGRADSARQTWFESDELIFSEGDIANRFYLIVAGKVALESPDSNGRVVLLQTVGNSELLGWSWMFSSYIWHLHARAVEPTEAIFFYGTRLRELCETDRGLGYEMFKRVAEVMMQRLETTRGLLLKQHCPDPTVICDWRPGQH